MQNKIAIVGEAWGETEERERMPFVGASGYELTKMLAEGGLRRADCFLTNVFNLRPQGNKIEAFCGGKKEAISGYPALVKGKFIRAEFASELDRLGEELLSVDPNLVVALGNTATWALIGQTAISKIRGTTSISTHTAEGFKVIGTFHPAAVLRQWELRPIVVADFAKAARECEFADIRRPKCKVWTEPGIDDILRFKSEYIDNCRILAVDIETSGNQITCIGFGPSKDLVIVIPIVDNRKASRCYWTNEKDEVQVWNIIKNILGDDKIKKVLQNGLYDVSFLYRSYGIVTRGMEHDDMLLHHALQPESLKGLGFLGSVYTDHGNWKQMREKTTTIKKDD